MKGFGDGSRGKKDKDGMGVGWGTVGNGEAWLCATGNGASVALGEGEGWRTGVGGGCSLGVGEAGCWWWAGARGRSGGIESWGSK